ncbi:MAG: dipicolinate synthase subunit B [Clostridia bacterium]|nr:dipicolinate synthase subunit B [Clostridia bacterium]
MTLEGKNIGFAMTGSFCTFSTVFQALPLLLETGANIIPILSPNAQTISTGFGTAEENIAKLESLCGKKSIKTIAEAEPIGPKKLLDALIIAPCTGNTLAKIAGGITDTSVTMAAKSTIRNSRPVILAVSTNDGLGGSAKNIGLLLNMKNIYFAPFGQDDPVKKKNSLVADMQRLAETTELALDGIQIQPLLLGPPDIK